MTEPILPADLEKGVLTSSCYASTGTTDDPLVGNYQVWGFQELVSGETQVICNSTSYPGVMVHTTNGDIGMLSKQVYSHVQEYVDAAGGSFRAWGMMNSVYYNRSAASKGSIVLQFYFREAVASAPLLTMIQVTFYCENGPSAIAEAMGIPSLSAQQGASLKSETGLCGRHAKNGACVDSFFFRAMSDQYGPVYVRVQAVLIDCFNMPIYHSECPPDLENVTEVYYGDWPDYDRAAGGPWTHVDMTALQNFARFTVTGSFSDLHYATNACPGMVSPSDFFEDWPNSKEELRSVLASYKSSQLFTFLCEMRSPKSLMGRIAYLWPAITTIHAIAMTVIVRYVYKAALHAHSRGYGDLEMQGNEQTSSVPEGSEEEESPA